MPITLKILDFHSPDVLSLREWAPSDVGEVYILVEMSIQERGAKGADLFQVMVATPEALRRRSRRGSPILVDRAIIIVSEFSWTEIRKHIDLIVKGCEGDTWNEAVLRLQRYFRWEYEDMVQVQDDMG